MKRVLDDDAAHAMDMDFCHCLGLDAFPDPLEDSAAFEEVFSKKISGPEGAAMLRASISAIDVEVQRLWAMKACFYAIEAKLMGKY